MNARGRINARQRVLLFTTLKMPSGRRIKYAIAKTMDLVANSSQSMISDGCGEGDQRLTLLDLVT